MLRQSQAPIQYQATRRADNASILTSGRAGEIIPISCGPLLRGDSGSGRIDIEMQLAEMPKPIENMVIARGQSWVIPRPALPHFEGVEEYVHSYDGTAITKLGASSRTPPALFDTIASGSVATAEASEFFSRLGLAMRSTTAINTDYVDGYILVANFRLNAASTKLTRYDYYSENNTTALELKPAFWPVNRMHYLVPDYEEALVKGQLNLELAAGQLPVSGIVFDGSPTYDTAGTGRQTDTLPDENLATTDYFRAGDNASTIGVRFKADSSTAATANPSIYAELAGQTVGTSLADIDKARTTEAMAKARSAMAGTNFSGFNMDDVIVANLMSGFVVPASAFQRPFLTDSRTTVFGMQERHATDAANLDDSATTGFASMSLSMNIPRMDYGGTYMVTVEIMPERLYERQQDPYLYVTAAADLPDALRDVQNTLPVDLVENARIDQKHTTPGGTFGYEPMNAKWRREFTRLGGEFQQLVPGTPTTTARTAIWQPDIVDQAFTSDHWLCPHPFPQDVFSAPSSDVVIISARQTLAITGLTQFGDELVEDNSEFSLTQAEQP